MSKLDTLISEFCSLGVEHEKLSKVLVIKNGKDYKKLSKGKYPVLGSGGIMTYIDQYAYDRASVLIPRKGSISNLFFIDTPFWTVDTLFYTEINEAKSLPKYIYYCLKKERLENLNTAGGVPSLTQEVLYNVRIPLPPLPVQEEIVRILDTFTALEAELEAELEARKKQYEYYREAMFICSKCQYYRVMDLTIDRYWLMPATPNFITEKGIPYITSKNVKKGNIDFGNVKYITEEDYQNVSRNREIQPNDVIIGMIGTLGEMAIVQPHDLPFYGQNMYLLRLNFQKINLRYFYHYFDTKQMKEYFQRVKNASSQGYLKANHIEDLSIPLPPLAEQERIVSILDRFDALVNDITQGLPAEIEARRKQYEYYRNQLLTFKEATP